MARKRTPSKSFSAVPYITQSGKIYPNSQIAAQVAFKKQRKASRKNKVKSFLGKFKLW